MCIRDRLKESPACIVSADEIISLNMEKTLKNFEQIPFRAEKILELNPNHEIFKRTLKNYCAFS